jgi:ATP-dependent Clp protease protease subunit
MRYHEEDDDGMVELEGPGAELRFLVPETKFISFTDEVNPETALELVDKLLLADLIEGPTRLLLNSPGGDVNSGIMIMDTILSLEHPVHAIVCGEAGSMGLYILQACQARYMTRNSSLFWHNPISISAVTSKDELNKFAKNYVRIIEQMDGMLRKRSDMDKETWDKTFKDKNNLSFSASEALKLGMIDGIVTKFKAAVKPAKVKATKVVKVAKVVKPE